ncbi:MAG: ATP-dependent Clp protease ATP-binding subunit ClpA [Deltaproteobacteria bacterium RIFCSPLOWO2_12_FULL_60_19]|nr:MAG: ATP-dependent Clp protease ATP-binding subunit ClpA [Deltaproteobacteria bacterium RIFCSPLOWO2_12_FULL_60_19]
MFTKELKATLHLAFAEAKARRHEFICVEHLLFALLKDQIAGSAIVHCGGDPARLKKGLEEFFRTHLEALPEGLDREPQETVGFHRVLQRAVVHAQSAEKKELNGGNLLAAIYREPDSYAAYLLEEQGITRFDIVNYISHGISKMPANDEEPASPSDAIEEDGPAPVRNPLEVFTVNLVKKAREGRIDPLIGRENEIERTIHVLCRRRKNNPIYVGDPGVGKTAIAEGLALKIHQGTVPGALKDAVVYALDMGALLAGTKFRGDFEARLKGVLNALKKQPNAILFIDEIHTVVGAGATSGGSLDASNILKPALASGDLRCIGSTTYHDYKSYFERDRALARRFQKIEISEPSVEESYEILLGLKSHYEKHHGVRYTAAALRAAVELSAKHLNDRRLPDKAIDVIDEVGAAVKLAPADKRKKVVGTRDIEQIIAKIAKIPPRSVSAADKLQIQNLDGELKSVVFGQNAAIETLSSAIKLSRSGLGQPEKPTGCFLFAGPTGVGKTEVAKQLARILGVEFLRFDMSEYMEKHTVSRLIGAPPGYVGFDQGGLLTDSVNRTPYAVLLLDEVEKAHPDLFNILLQVMDHATLTDNNGRKADFRNIILIMTSNAGAREMSGAPLGFGATTNAGKGKEAIEKTFSPEFRNRLDAIIHFNALDPEVILCVVDKFVKELNLQLEEKKVSLSVTPRARAWLGRKGYDPVFGARPMARLIQTEIKRPLADEILFGKLQNGGKVQVDENEDKLSFNYFTAAKPIAPEPAVVES